MLTIMDSQPNRTCQGLGRREFLRIGGLGLGGLALPQLLAARAEASTVPGAVRDKSVVLLFLNGGPPHIEFFDPKMTAPSEIRSLTGEVSTKLPGITFGGTFPKLAAMADRLTIVRSYGSGNASHTYGKVLSAGNKLEATMSSLYAKVRGNNHPRTGIPTNTLILPEAIQGDLKLGSNFETKALSTMTQAGKLGPTFSAFNPAGGGQLQQDMELKVTPDRLQDRRSLLGTLDTLQRQVDRLGILDDANTYHQQAFDVIMRGVAEAFDLSQEDPRTVERYDTSKIFDMKDLQRYYDMRRVSNLLGKQMLLARRLCGAGCGFVTVSDCGWDYHANKNSPKQMAGIWPMGNQVDHAVSVFLEDVRERGLSDKILLAVTGEMGRSPRINKNGGRDHYGEMTSLLLAGGGLEMGQVIGQSDRQAAKAATTPYRPQHLMATIMHTLFDIGKVRLDQSLSRELVQLLEKDHPIDRLF
ncbi:MAG: DUF1501 domain-containing protein [Pirellulaceae bacterium]